MTARAFIIYKLDYNNEENQRIIYPGSTISMGFDELGKHGVILGDIDKEKVNLEFLPIDNKEFKVLTFGMENKSDIMPRDIILSENGSTYKIDLDGKTYNVNVAVGGNHFVLNSLCAIAIGRIFDIEMKDVLEGVANFELTKSRMQVEKNKSGLTVINDSYNANYDSMKAALEYLGKINANKKIAVLGDMLELGEYSENLHEKVGEEVKKNNIDILITVGEMSKYIANKAIECGFEKNNLYECVNNQEAIDTIERVAKKGDAVLLKASNGLNFQEIFQKICEK